MDKSSCGNIYNELINVFLRENFSFYFFRQKVEYFTHIYEFLGKSKLCFSNSCNIKKKKKFKLTNAFTEIMNT